VKAKFHSEGKCKANSLGTALDTAWGRRSGSNNQQLNHCTTRVSFAVWVKVVEPDAKDPVTERL